MEMIINLGLCGGSAIYNQQDTNMNQLQCWPDLTNSASTNRFFGSENFFYFI